LVLLVAWCVSNLLLLKLIVHKAARASGVLARKNFFLGFVFVASAFAFLYSATGQTSAQTIVHKATDSPYITPVLALFLLGAMTQIGDLAISPLADQLT
jgi:NAD(P)H-quinone oxidoreductase subunit 5